jgi:hypothetical protein
MPEIGAASRFLVILVVLGVSALAAGVIYYVEAANSLSAFFPCHVAHLRGRHTTRGLAASLRGRRCLWSLRSSRSGRRSSRYR